MTKEQIEFRKAFHAGMDAGVVYVNNAGCKAYRDDENEEGPYVYESPDDYLGTNRLDPAWNSDEWRPLPAEPAWKPEPFERVICRDSDDRTWRCNLFSHESSSSFFTIGSFYSQIAPYAGNEDCVGTTKPAKNTLKK